jgi:BirA family transcriptional regulator, biotin operon repressor / biotin---[acetyl-CoA-carboxylase] ligase
VEINTLFTGQNVIELPECPSVNTYATELLKAVNLPEGTIIHTKKQTAGRGQRGNTWVSEEGKNVTMSLILHPSFLRASDAFLLSMTVSLALHDLLTATLTETHEIKIKWPNDMYVDGKKIAGILIENVLREDHLQSSVIGIGLNVNQEDFGSLNSMATSVKNLSGREVRIEEMLSKICSKVEARYLNLRAKSFEKIKLEYLEKLLDYGVKREFKTPAGEQFSGTIQDVRLDGKLMIEGKGGEKRFFEMKELIF